MTTLATTSWTAGEPFNPSAALTADLLAFADLANDAIKLLQNCYTYLAVVMTFQAVLSVPTTIARVRILRQHDARGGMAVRAFMRHGASVAQDGSRLQAKRRNVHVTVLSLIAEALGVREGSFRILTHADLHRLDRLHRRDDLARD